MFSCNAVGGEIVVKQGEIGENFYVIEQVVIVTTIVIVMITIFVVMTTVLVIALTTMIAIMMTTIRSSIYLSNPRRLLAGPGHDPGGRALGEAGCQHCRR